MTDRLDSAQEQVLCGLRASGELHSFFKNCEAPRRHHALLAEIDLRLDVGELPPAEAHRLYNLLGA